MAAVVACKLPDYWVDDPDTWFRQAEAAFRRSNITVSSTKYDHVLLRLPGPVLTATRTLIRSIDDDTVAPYELLKAKILRSFGPNKYQLVAKLLDYPSLGDKRPSELMDAMLALLPAGESPDTMIFRVLFMRRLPSDMRQQLAAREYDTPEEMAEQADILYDARGPAVIAAALSAAAIDRRRSSPADRRRSPDERPSRTRDRRAATPGAPKVCFIHKKWGDAAHNCVKPCSYRQGNGPAAPGDGH